MKESNTKTNLKHIVLFVITIVTTTLAGAEWMYGGSFFYAESTMGWREFIGGFEYSIPFLLILTAHEFGHYFVAKRNNIQVSLPFYLPMWLGFLPLLLPTIGTFGAFIRIKGFVKSKRQHFDIGIAGPLSGFIVAIVVLFYGYTHLPEPEYVYQIHPNYEQYGEEYAEVVYTYDYHKKQHYLNYLNLRTADSIAFVNINQIGEWSYKEFKPFEEYPSLSTGKPLLMIFFEKYIVDDPSRIPNSHEMMHYPWLLAGFLALFFTALNLLPIGQLDGGHVLYGLLGSKLHKPIAEIFFILLLIYAGLGMFSPYHSMNVLIWIPAYIGFLYLALKGLNKSKLDTTMYAVVIFTLQFLIAWIKPNLEGYQGWLLFAFLIGRFLGVHHPIAIDESPLDLNRKILGWIALIVFIISFSPQPLIAG